MNYYKKRFLNNLLLGLLFLIGIVLQIYGQSKESYLGLGIQFISLIILIFTLYLYNRRFS